MNTNSSKSLSDNYSDIFDIEYQNFTEKKLMLALKRDIYDRKDDILSNL